MIKYIFLFHFNNYQFDNLIKAQSTSMNHSQSSSVVSEKNMENTQNLRTFWEFLLQNFYKSHQNFAANRSADLFYF